MTSKAVTITDYHTEIPGSIINKTWVFPTCFYLNANGKQMEYTITVRAIKLPDASIPAIEYDESMFIDLNKTLFDNKPLAADIYGYILVRSGMTGGKIRTTVPRLIKAGKNLKSKSATNTFCQALRDALGIYNKQVAKCKDIQSVGTPDLAKYPPMLAQIFKDQKKPITYPVSEQRKYNGVRAVIMQQGNTIHIYSRKLKPYFGFNLIRDEAQALIGNTNIFLDGELYKHGIPLQVISGIARRDTAKEGPKTTKSINADHDVTEEHIDYMIYDCFIPEKPELTFTERRLLLESIFSNVKTTRCHLVETITANSADEVYQYYNNFLKEGFEGAMVRLDAPYEYSWNDKHSKVLLKLKETYDAEFKITGWETGTNGKAASAIMLKCETDSGEAFNVTPALPLAERNELARMMNSIEANNKTVFDNGFLGKKLIVYFDEKSVNGVPQRGRTKMEIREWD